jgi:hypothetical protein
MDELEEATKTYLGEEPGLLDRVKDCANASPIEALA